MGAVSHPTSKKEPGAFRNHRLSFFPKHQWSLGDDDSGRDFQPSSSTFQLSQARENSHFCEWKSSTCLGCYRILNPDPEIRLARNPSHTHCWCSFGPVLGALVSNSLLLWTRGAVNQKISLSAFLREAELLIAGLLRL